jgi:hypothetical protein
MSEENELTGAEESARAENRPPVAEEGQREGSDTIPAGEPPPTHAEETAAGQRSAGLAVAASEMTTHAALSTVEMGTRVGYVVNRPYDAGEAAEIRQASVTAVADAAGEVLNLEVEGLGLVGGVHRSERRTPGTWHLLPK